MQLNTCIMVIPEIDAKRVTGHPFPPERTSSVPKGNPLPQVAHKANVILI